MSMTNFRQIKDRTPLQWAGILQEAEQDRKPITSRCLTPSGWAKYQAKQDLARVRITLLMRAPKGAGEE